MNTEYKDEEIRTQEEEDEENLDHFLSGLDTGYTIVISRQEPAWCKGFLAEIAVDQSSSPLSLNDLVSQWGGHRLRLKFRRPNGTWAAHRDVPLYSFPPRVMGVDLQQSPRYPIHQNQQLQTQIQTQEPKQEKADDTKRILELMQMMSAMRAADNQAMSELIRQQNAQQSSVDPLRMMQGLLGMMTTMRSVFSGQPAEESHDDDKIIGMISQLAGLFRPQPQTPPPRLSAPNDNPAVDAAMPLDLQLSKQGPGALETFRNAVSRMPSDHQAQTLSALIGSIEEIGGRDLLLSELENRGIIGPEFDDEYEPESSDVEDPRGAAESNEGDDTIDR